MIEDLNSAYDSCVAVGFIQFRKDIDIELAKSLHKSALDSIEILRDIEGMLEKKKFNFSFLYTSRYDILRKLLDALLIFDKVKSSNHQCINAYICVKHQEWELDWNTLETMRLLRNGICYEGKHISLDVWKSQKLKFEIYIKTLLRIIEDKISAFRT
ncbi:MAG TPA: hypothetical protein VJI46_07140 [Candidatus Nanoarchaeia archaeon]|nr:hypothetical protein [Candidatus Nanoarchaeia archaeon]